MKGYTVYLLSGHHLQIQEFSVATVCAFHGLSVPEIVVNSLLKLTFWQYPHCQLTLPDKHRKVTSNST